MKRSVLLVCYIFSILGILFSMDIDQFKEKYNVYAMGRGIGSIQKMDFVSNKVTDLYSRVSEFSIQGDNIMCYVWGDNVDVQHIRLLLWEFVITHDEKIDPDLDDGKSTPTEEHFVFYKSKEGIIRFFPEFQVIAFDPSNSRLLCLGNEGYVVKNIVTGEIERIKNINQIKEFYFVGKDVAIIQDSFNRVLRYSFVNADYSVITSIEEGEKLSAVSADGSKFALLKDKKLYLFDIHKQTKDSIIDLSDDFAPETIVFTGVFLFIPEGTGLLYARYSEELAFWEISTMYKDSDLYYFDLVNNKEYLLKKDIGQGGIGIQRK